MAPKTYGKTRWRNIWACGCMIMSIEDVLEPKLWAAGFLKNGVGLWTPQDDRHKIFQGAYSDGSLSGGTHGGGGAGDSSRETDAENLIWQSCGIAVFERGDDRYNDTFDPHWHVLWINCPHLSGAADNQIDDWYDHLNGLVSHRRYTGPWIKPITWQDAYDKYVKPGPPPGEKGLFGMSKSIYHRRTEDQRVSAKSTYVDIKVNNADSGYTVIGGKTAQVTCSVVVHVSGLKPGEFFNIVWRIVKYKKDATAVYPHTRLAMRGFGQEGGGIVTVGATYNGGLPGMDGGYEPRLRVGALTNSKTAVVTDVICEGWSA